MRFVGLFICFAIVFGAITQIGLDFYSDFKSATFVLGGATGYTLLANKSLHWCRKFSKGSVFFGWLGTLIGLIAITGGSFDKPESIDSIGPALSVAMLPIFYGYLTSLFCMTIDSGKD